MYNKNTQVLILISDASFGKNKLPTQYNKITVIFLSLNKSVQNFANIYSYKKNKLWHKPGDA